jgi:hypothetical protein
METVIYTGLMGAILAAVITASGTIAAAFIMVAATRNVAATRPEWVLSMEVDCSDANTVKAGLIIIELIKHRRHSSILIPVEELLAVALVLANGSTRRDVGSLSRSSRG